MRSLDDQICGICGITGEVYLGDGNQKNCCRRGEVATFVGVFFFRNSSFVHAYYVASLKMLTIIL